MRITYGGVNLTPTPFEQAAGLAVNGRQVVQVSQALRAAAAVAHGRGNRSTTVAFRVGRVFDTLGEALEFEMLHQGELPKSAALYMESGHGAEARACLLSAAALEGVDVAGDGLTRVISYTFQGGLPVAVAVIEDDETSYYSEYDLTVKKNRMTLAAGIESQAVTFATAFEGDPEVYPVLIAPSGQPDVAIALAALPVSTGFTVRFAAPLPAAGYVLSWIAFD